MGKAARWFRGLLGLKKEESPSQSAAATTTNRSDSKPAKKRWSFVKSYREKDHGSSNAGSNRRVSHRDGPLHASGFVDDDDPNKHAIAVAAATAAVAEAAVAAAQAAAAVVRLTSSGRSTGTPNAAAAYVSSAASCGIHDEWAAAVKIQSHFRAYLSRRALRALKALVKLQALVRGHIVRKQTADMLRRMQALLRAQSRARAGRIPITETPHSSTKSSQFFPPGPATPEKFENAIRTKSIKHDQISMLKRSGSKSVGKMIGDQDKAQNGSNWVDRRVDEGSRNQEGSSIRTGPTDDEKSDKILEIDTVKHFKSKNRSHSLSSHHSFTTSRDSTTHQTLPSPSSCEVQSLNPLIFTENVEETSFCTADNSPQFYSASSKGGSSKRSPFTPSISDGSRSYLSGYSDYPNYMSYTESSRAKVRSLSAPKQRPQFERSSSTKRYSVHGCGESRSSTLRVSTLQSNFASKAYPGSGRLDRLGMPIGGDSVSFNGGNWNRY